MKNPTPRGIVLGTSLSTGIIILLFLIAGELAGIWDLDWTEFTVLPLLVVFTSYLVQFNALERFIYRKIKVIYKNISEQKTPKGSIKSKVSMGKDILSEVEQEARQWSDNQKLEISQLRASAKYRREFLGNVSHELKTPIFSIQGYIDTLIDGAIEDRKINKSYLLKASKNVDRLISIVMDLENINLLESGKLNLNLRVFDIVKLAAEAIDLLEEQAEESKVHIDFKPGLKKSVEVYADRERIQQVLVNLLTNAIRYSSKNGEALIGIYDMGERVLVEVSDDGIGIAADDLPRVFERFFRTDKARSREQGGTGLGLSIAKHIVEAHGMRVNVRSTKGVGSTFGFQLAKK